MAVGDKVLSSLAMEWYEALNNVVNNYGPGKSGYTAVMNSTSKKIGAGAGQQTLWTGTAFEPMTITSITAYVYVSISGSSSQYCPTLTFQVNGTTQATINASATIAARTSSGLSISVKAGDVMALVSSGSWSDAVQRDTTTFVSGSFIYTSNSSSVGTLATTDIAQGNIIHATDINNLINKYNNLVSYDNLYIGGIIPDIPNTVTVGALIQNGLISDLNDISGELNAVTCRNLSTCTLSCYQSVSIAHDDYTSLDQKAYTSANYCTNAHAAVYCYAHIASYTYHDPVYCYNITSYTYHDKVACYEKQYTKKCEVVGYIPCCYLYTKNNVYGSWIYCDGYSYNIPCYLYCYYFIGMMYRIYAAAYTSANYCNQKTKDGYSSANYCYVVTKAAYYCYEVTSYTYHAPVYTYHPFYTDTSTVRISSCSNTTSVHTS